MKDTVEVQSFGFSIVLTVEFSVTPEEPMTRDSPGSDAEIEISRVFRTVDAAPIDVTDGISEVEWEIIYKELQDQLETEATVAAEQQAEAEYEAWKNE